MRHPNSDSNRDWDCDDFIQDVKLLTYDLSVIHRCITV